MANCKVKNRRARPHSNPVKLARPGDDDILCGKDRACALHKGSQRFRCVIDGYCETYQKAATKYDKMQITKEIYEVLSQNSRFLKYNDSEMIWEEITPLQARDKIGHALRFANNHTTTIGKGTTTTKSKKKSKKVTGLVRQNSFSSSSATSNSTAAAGDDEPSKAELVAELVEVAKDEPKVWDSLVDRLTNQEARVAPTSGGHGPTLDGVASRHNRMASLVDPVALENIAYAMESNTEDAALDDLISLLNNDEFVTEEDLQDALMIASVEAEKSDVPPTVSISVVEQRPTTLVHGMKPMRCTSLINPSSSGSEDETWSSLKHPLLDMEDDY